MRELSERIGVAKTGKTVTRQAITHAIDKLLAINGENALITTREYDDDSQRFCVRYSLNPDFPKKYVDDDRILLISNKWEKKRFDV